MTQPAEIGRYRIVRPLGHGGMGLLYLAADPKLDRQLAIKLIQGDGDAETRERFAREARAAARLRHPNIVTVFDVGEQDGRPFIAMEFIEGRTLAAIIRDGDVPLARRLELIDALCDGLGFAHRAGVVHRDIKPANLMLGADGVLKILDFGIARLAHSTALTQSGQISGTLNYMSPEQLAGRPIDHRSDIFAVGAVSYELLSGRPAFSGSLLDGLYNRIVNEPVAPLALQPHTADAELTPIIGRALAKDPTARYQDLAAMRDDLRRARSRLPVARDDAPAPLHAAADVETFRAKTPPAAATTIRLAPRQAARWRVAAAAAVAMVAAGGLTWWLYVATRPGTPPPQLQSPPSSNPEAAPPPIPTPDPAQTAAAPQQDVPIPPAAAAGQKAAGRGTTEPARPAGLTPPPPTPAECTSLRLLVQVQDLGKDELEKLKRCPK